jgi:hypothetical protein
MTIKASQYGLHPDDDLTDPEKQADLYRYWEALKMQIIQHMTEHNEVIPFSTVWLTLARDFPTYPVEEIQDACYAGMDLVLGVDDEDEDWEEVPEHELSEADKAVRDDFLNFIQAVIKKKREEEELFYSLLDDPNGR